jgi:hypothetical protein
MNLKPLGRALKDKSRVGTGNREYYQVMSDGLNKRGERSWFFADIYKRGDE